MLINYIKTTLRHFWRQRLFTALNVLGLAIGISASWIIYRMVDYEFSFDRKHPDSEQIFQVVCRSKGTDGIEGEVPGVSKGVLPSLIHDVSGLEAVVPVYYKYSETATIVSDSKGEPLVVEGPENQIGTLASYFELVPYRWLAGNPKTALDAPNKVVLTRSRAELYFPRVPVQNILGKTILYDNTLSAIVSGVVDDLDYLSSFDAQEFFSISAQDMVNDDWGSRSSNELLYVKSEKGVSPDHILAQINTVNLSHNKEKFEKYNFKIWFELLPLAEKHFAVKYSSHTRTANKKVLFGLIGIAVFLLALACINYINLSTAQLPQRAKEIGIRKTLGSTPAKLINRFLGETLLITLIAVGLSFFITSIALDIFKDFIPEGMQDFVSYKRMISFSIILIVVITLLSGLYPAWLVTRVQTVNVLQGQTEKVIGKVRFKLREILIVFQFIVAQVFIISVLIIGLQLQYSLKKDLGFDHEAVLYMDIPYNIRNDELLKGKQFVLKRNLEKHSELVAVALGVLPMSGNMTSQSLYHQSDTGKIVRQVMLKNIDADYIHLYDITLLAGKNLQESDTTREYIINEVALKEFGFPTPEAAIGQQLTSWDDKGLPITGVVSDFHQFNTKSDIAAVAFISEKDYIGVINIKLPASPSKWKEAIAIIEKEWKLLYPGTPFEYKFYDDAISDLYKQEFNTSKLVGAATGITILIGCLGLFGLATLTAFQRTKEIGVRKVLGASVGGIIQLLSKDFIKLVVLAILIASPIAWWAMNKWLQDFAYHIEIQWWMFALAGTLAVVIALVTVSFQAVKAAVANPVDSLRDE